MMGFDEWMKGVCGKLIERIEVEDDSIIIALVGGQVFELQHVQDCCERRYFVLDDDVTYYHSAELRDIKMARWANLGYEPQNYVDTHEIMFLDIYTTKGVISICAHNEHNGYYGGISVGVKVGGHSVCYVPDEVES